MHPHDPNSAILYLALSLFLYFLPSYIARFRHHPQRWPIFWLTLLAGWTGAGWIAAFVWSVVNFRQHAPSPDVTPQAPFPSTTSNVQERVPCVFPTYSRRRF
jgi:hypothetical protein